MQDNDHLVDYLVKRGHISSDRVERAFRNVDRKDFVPDQFNRQAYDDQALPIEPGATISAPHMVAISTELLHVKPEDKVIEIGSGSGYQVAVLSELVEYVVGVEVLESLAEKSRERLEDRDNVEIRYGNGFDVVDEGERFDKILFSCAVDSVEKARDYLKGEGVIVAPVNEDDHQVLKRFKGEDVTEYGRVGFVDFFED